MLGIAVEVIKDDADGPVQLRFVGQDTRPAHDVHVEASENHFGAHIATQVVGGPAQPDINERGGQTFR